MNKQLIETLQCKLMQTEKKLANAQQEIDQLRAKLKRPRLTINIPRASGIIKPVYDVKPKIVCLQCLANQQVNYNLSKTIKHLEISCDEQKHYARFILTQFVAAHRQFAIRMLADTAKWDTLEELLSTNDDFTFYEMFLINNQKS
jgi:hypothetical protein